MKAWEKAILGVPLSRTPSLLPGVGVSLGVMLVATYTAAWLGTLVLRLQGVDPAGKGSPISAISVAVILGIIIANLIRVPEVLKPGFDFAVKKVLRLGIILVGLKLSFIEVFQRGLWGVPVVFAVIATALVVVPWLAERLKVGSRLGILTAAATGICGITATVAVAPVIEAEDREVAYTIANVTLFGVIAMLFYPLLAHFVFGSASGSAGLFMGTAVHDTSQVMGAALSYREVFHDDLAFKVATITKLTRNIFLVAVVPYLGWLHARQTGHTKKVKILSLFPMFVLGFLGMAALRSVGDAAWPGEQWQHVTKMFGETGAVWALGTALASVGLTTRLSVFKGLGLRPLWVGAIAALIVGAVGMTLGALFGTLVG